VLQKLQGEKMSDFLNVNGLEEFDDLLGSIYEQKEAVKIQRNQWGFRIYKNDLGRHTWMVYSWRF
jgi:hypothetical protein